MIDREPEAGFIRQLLLECGGQLRRLRQEQQMEPRQKRGYTDLVTQHDRWAQDFLASRIAKQYPSHGLLGEEGLDRRGNSPWLWVIDPIDGTSNYIYWGREYAISLGLFFQGKPWYGAVLDVESMELHESPAAPQPPVPGGDARHGVLHVGFQRRAVSGLRLPGAVPPGPRGTGRLCQQPSEAVGFCRCAAGAPEGGLLLAGPAHGRRPLFCVRLFGRGIGAGLPAMAAAHGAAPAGARERRRIPC